MRYTPLVNKSLRMCAEFHEGQTDMVGMPYVLHPVSVAEMIDPNVPLYTEHVCTALLHDVIVKGTASINDLISAGIPRIIVDAVELLSSSEQGTTYLAHIAHIAQNPIARCVKIADLKHDTDLERMHFWERGLAEEEKKRYEKDCAALRFLQSVS